MFGKEPIVVRLPDANQPDLFETLRRAVDELMRVR
jgi:hypothetical protein